jgi:hypothetical protein
MISRITEVTTLADMLAERSLTRDDLCVDADVL